MRTLRIGFNATWILAIACAWNTMARAQSSPQVAPQRVVLGQTETQRESTLQSVVRLDDHPLYLMKYYGGYDADANEGHGFIPHSSAAWACSVFVALGSKVHPVFGRNFDWEDNPAVVLFTDSPEGYASISMVDVSYLGYERVDKKFDSMDGRQGLLDAPLIPFDGINEHGLTVGMAAVEGSELPKLPDVPTVGSLRIIRLILDQCRTVDEGLSLFQKYNIDFEEGPQIHYLLADAAGKSALVELAGGKLNISRNEKPWQAATNFYLTGNEGRTSELCHRYAQIEKRLNQGKGILSDAEALSLLKDVAQVNTRWSVVYDMKDGIANIVMSRHFEHPIRLTLAKEKPAEKE